MGRRRRSSRGSKGTSLKTYLAITGLCVVVVLVIEVFISLTKSAKEGLEDAAANAVQQAVKAEVAKAARGGQ